MNLRQQIATTVLSATKYRELMSTMRANRPNDDLDIVRRAYEYSLKHHEGQLRASGEPYVVHPLETALVLADMKMDPVAVAAGLLHDSVEDTSVTTVDIRKEFGRVRGDLGLLAGRYGVSEPAVEIRCKSLGLINNA